MIHTCIVLLRMNFPLSVFSGGSICGYFFVACLAFSSSFSAGPGYRGASLRIRWGCEGGLKRAGFSRTRFCLGLCLAGLEALALVEAARTEIMG